MKEDLYLLKKIPKEVGMTKSKSKGSSVKFKGKFGK